jgi:hypothetical protein
LNLFLDSFLFVKPFRTIILFIVIVSSLTFSVFLFLSFLLFYFYLLWACHIFYFFLLNSYFPYQVVTFLFCCIYSFRNISLFLVVFSFVLTAFRLWLFVFFYLFMKPCFIPQVYNRACLLYWIQQYPLFVLSLALHSLFLILKLGYFLESFCFILLFGIFLVSWCFNLSIFGYEQALCFYGLNLYVNIVLVLFGFVLLYANILFNNISSTTISLNYLLLS